MAAPVNQLPAQPTKKSWLPTRKWLAAEATAAGTLAIMLLTGDSEVTDPETIAIVGFAVQAVTTWALPNRSERTEGGVPLKGTGL
jgi:dienelactone hydrolase